MATDERTGMPLRVDLAEELGARRLRLRHRPLDGGEEQMVVRVDGRLVPHLGDTLQLVIDPNAIHAFHPETGERLGD